MKKFLLNRIREGEFEIDVWDEVILNCHFNTLEELYESYKHYAGTRK